MLAVLFTTRGDANVTSLEIGDSQDISCSGKEASVCLLSLRGKRPADAVASCLPGHLWEGQY